MELHLFLKISRISHFDMGRYEKLLETPIKNFLFD